MRVPSELAGRWNHNTHYYPLALAATPCVRALDVGCGDALLLRLLAERCSEAVGVDPWTDPALVSDVPNATVLREDFLAAVLPAAWFDLVCSFASIHHMPFETALRRMAGLVRPGGRLVVCSLPRYTPLSWLVAGTALPAHQTMSRRRGYYPHPAPIADPEHTLREVRAITRRVLPTARVRRRLYWRYTVEWTAPA